MYWIQSNIISKMQYLLLSSLFIFSCQPIAKFQYERQFDETDHIPIFYIGDPVPEHYSVLGEIHVRSGDYEINEPCAFETALDKLIIKSINRGGDSVKIISVKRPDEQNLCWRISGLSLSYDR